MSALQGKLRWFNWRFKFRQTTVEILTANILSVLSNCYLFLVYEDVGGCKDLTFALPLSVILYPGVVVFFSWILSTEFDEQIFPCIYCSAMTDLNVTLRITYFRCSHVSIFRDSMSHIFVSSCNYMNWYTHRSWSCSLLKQFLSWGNICEVFNSFFVSNWVLIPCTFQMHHVL